MRYEMRAEYGPDIRPAPDAVVKIWHMVEAGELEGLCGRDLSTHAATQSEERWGQMRDPFCHSCGALYLRQVA